MAVDLGPLFLGCALAPAERARSHFDSDRWAAGISSISADALRCALSEAAERIASLTGVSQDAVQRHVPRDEVQAVLDALAVRHKEALETARRYSSSLTSFVSRSLHIEDSTAVAYLRAIAARHTDDEFLCAPISTFAEQLAAWQRLIERCARDVSADKSLLSSYRRRRLMRVAVFASMSLAAVGALSWTAGYWLGQKRAHSRIEASLAKSDPCADETLDSADRPRGTDGQMARLKSRELVCALNRRRQQYEARCEVLAAHVESGHLTSEDVSWAGQSGSVLDRVAHNTLILADLTLNDMPMPCEDTPVGARLWRALANAAAKADALWGQADLVSPKMASFLYQNESLLSAQSQQQLVSHAEVAARHAIVMGRPDDIRKAHAICKVQTSLHVEPVGRGCKALFRLSRPE